MKRSEAEQKLEGMSEDEMFLLMNFIASEKFNGAFHDEGGDRWSCYCGDGPDDEINVK